MFGETSSPYLAAECVQKHGELKASELPRAVEVIKHRLYADDTISGTQDVQEAIATL